MKRIKVLVVFGTRPEAIKMAPVVLQLREKNNIFETTVCVTAQHREMLDQVLEVFEISPELDLNLMQANQDLTDVTTSVMNSMKKVITDVGPDVVLVHGDTTTAMATAMCSFYLGVKVGHVEAGLRTNDLQAPFPEEFNRQVISKVSTLHFAPTAESSRNLFREGHDEHRVFVTGNTVIDSLLWVKNKLDASVTSERELRSFFYQVLGFDVTEQTFVLITGHRRENMGDGFDEIFGAVSELATKHPSISFVYPVHLNPRVKVPAQKLLGHIPNVHLIEPLQYEAFVYLLSHCYMLLTDSGGLQEEAPSLGKPVLVMRDLTERPEALQAGTIKLVGCDRDKIIESVSLLLEDSDLYASMSAAENPFGDGRSAVKITTELERYFDGGKQ